MRNKAVMIIFNGFRLDLVLRNQDHRLYHGDKEFHMQLTINVMRGSVIFSYFNRS